MKLYDTSTFDTSTQNGRTILCIESLVDWLNICMYIYILIARFLMWKRVKHFRHPWTSREMQSSDPSWFSFCSAFPPKTIDLDTKTCFVSLTRLFFVNWTINCRTGKKHEKNVTWYCILSQPWWITGRSRRLEDFNPSTHTPKPELKRLLELRICSTWFWRGYEVKTLYG